MHRIPWPRVLAEGTVIVSSILLAFAIDAWWDGRTQEHNQSVLLRALLDDLLEKQELLTYRRQYNQAILEAAQALINSEANGGLGQDEVDQLIGFTWWYNDPSDWDSAPMSALLIGGGLSSVSNPELLQRLSELQFQLGGLRNLSENDQNFHNDILVPFFIEHVSLPEIANASTHVPGHPDRPYLFPEFEIAVRQDNSSLLENREFRSLLVAKIDKLIDMRNEYEDFERQVAESIQMIHDELSDN